MLPEEARWLGARLAALGGDPTPLCNLGSSTGEFVTVRQPWIHRHLFAPLAASGRPVVNVDLKAAPGVDLVGDVCDPAFRADVAARGCGALLCNNLLEHVAEPAALASALVELVPRGGTLLISGPRSYPWHPDPIDTGFRPGVAELAALFPGTELVEGAVVPSGTYWEWLDRSPRRFARAMWRLLAPWDDPPQWWASLLKLGWLFRPFTATCVVLRRS